jgi:hypothetical protein
VVKRLAIHPKELEAMRFRYLVVGSVVAGVCLFVWGALSNMLLPLGSGALREFSEDAAVVQSIRANAPANGIYLSPKGVFAAVSFQPDMSDRAASIAPFLAREFAADVAIGLMLAILLGLAGVSTAGQAAAVTGAAALAAGVAVPVSDWNWFGFSPAFTAGAAVELLIGWILAGLVLVLLKRKLSAT